MPLDSTAVMQMTGMYAQSSMSQMAYSQQIGMGGYGGPGNGAFGDRMMGGAMNAAGAIGSPMMSAVGTLAPMGISAGLGLGMAASTGIGIPIAAGVSAMQYAGGQMYNGAQQQQALNSGLRGSFGFQNQYGGQGFNRADMSQIGGMVRTMSDQVGPGGQMASFGELSQIASKMGGMGLAQGVKDVQDFSKKFKETVTALKTMAKDLGTTLEGAMEFASAARTSGVFGMNNASKFSSMARGTAASGGLAMSEVTAMANIGSQVSRSIGGLGRQGAVAGMKTIGQIGTAQQMGLLSDEDVYNVTGLTGAEGRQAFASSQMQKAGSFLQGGKGRRLLASMADRNGQLDPTAVMQLMGGGMGVGDTMANDRSHVTGAGAPVNRANFIRNEGRLRGQALQEFGAFLPAMQMMQWAQSKGIDVNNMDDRSMLFMQRQLGMGRDEADQSVKMAQNMPRILDEMHQRQAKDAFRQDYTQGRKGAGIEGLKSRFDQAREKVNSTFQKIGQDFFNEGSEALESFVGKLTGDYQQRFSEEAFSAYQGAKMGTGSRTAGQSFKTFMGPSGGRGILGPGSGGIEAFNRGADLTGGRGDTTNNALRGGLGDALGTRVDRLVRGESDSSKFARAGYRVTATDNAGLAKQLQQFGDIARAAGEPGSNKYMSLGAENADWIREGLASGSIAGSGEQRLASFDTMMQEKGSASQKAAWNSAKNNPIERSRMMSSMAMGAGMNSQAASMGLPQATSQFFGAHMTDSERREAFSKAFIGDSSSNKLGRGIGAGILGGVTGGLLSGVGAKMGATMFGDRGRDQALGEFLDSSEASRLVGNLASGDKQTMASARLSAQKQLDEIRQRGAGGKPLSDEDKAKIIGLSGLLAANDYEAALVKGNGTVSPEELERIGKAHGVSPGQIKQMAEATRGIQGQKWKENVDSVAKQVGGMAEKRMGALQSSGIATFEGTGITLSAASSAKMGTQASNVARRLLEVTALEADAKNRSSNGDTEGAARDLDKAQRMSAQAFDFLAGKSVEEKRAIAMGMSKGGMSEEARGILASASSQDRLQKTTRKKGDLAAVSSMLGVELDADTLKTMKGASAEEKAKLITQAAGGSGANQADLAAIFQSLAKGGTGKANQLLQQLQGDKQFQQGMHDKLEQKQRDDNPLQDAMAKSLDKIASLSEKQTKSMELVARHTGATAEELKELNVGDSESGTKSAGQPGGKK